MSKRNRQLFERLNYCIRCCIPETEEGTLYDEMNVCKACQSSEQKMHIDWAERERQLKRIFAEARRKASSGYDCVLPISGGKDSMFQAHVLVNVYGMKPLAVTFNHNWYSETGWYNLTNLLETFNLDHIMFTPNRGLVNRLASKSLSSIGDPCWHCHSGCGSFPLQVAVKFRIPLLVYGESASEGHGLATYYEPVKYDREYFTKISAKKRPEEMVCEDISGKDVSPFRLPSQEECEEAQVTGIHLGDYIFWDDERQTEFVRDVYGWRETQMENSYKRYKSAECVMAGMHDFTCYLKRGYCRATSQGAVDVRNGLLTREEAFGLISRTDPVRPEALDYFLEITGMTEEDFYRVMEALRLPHLRGFEMPVLPKERPNEERILPFSRQLIERLRSRSLPFYEIDRTDAELPQGGKAEISDELGMSGRQIVAAILRKELSPTEVARACIKRIEGMDRRVEAFETFDPEYLLRQAAEAEARLAAGSQARILEGVPVGVKDVFNTRELPTQMGSPIWRGFSPGNDARTVFNIRRAGGVVAGKTVTAEFAVHTLGKTLNPHDISRTPGTSSSGSAVATALGMVPIALGTQTAGSIVRPASFCGVYGYKPSFGLVPRTGVLKTTDSLDTIGFFTTYFEDIETVFEAIRVHGKNYPVSDAALNDPARRNKPRERPWRIAFFQTHVWDDAEHYAREAITEWLGRLSAERIDIIEVDTPEMMKRAHEIHATIYDCALAYYFKDEAEKKELVSPIMYELIENGRRVTRSQYHQALRDQEELIHLVDDIMTGYDAGVSLSTAGEAPLREQREKPDPALIWNLSHLPTMSVPAFRAPSGLPFGAQIFSRKYNDYLLLGFASYLRERNMIPGASNPLVSLAGRHV